MAIEHLTSRDNLENKATTSAFNVAFTAQDNDLLLKLRAVGNLDTASTLPSMTIGDVKVGNNHYSNDKIAAAADSATSGDSIEIITGAGSRSELFHTKPQERTHVVVPHVSPEAVPANPNDEPIKIIPYSGPGSRAHLFRNPAESGDEKIKH